MDKLKELKIVKNKIDELNDERNLILKSDSDYGMVRITYEDISKLREIDDEINKLVKRLGVLNGELSEQIREDEGYTVFGVKRDHEGILTTECRVIDVSLKEKYDNKFKPMTSPTLPNIIEIDYFIGENSK